MKKETYVEYMRRIDPKYRNMEFIQSGSFVTWIKIKEENAETEKEIKRIEKQITKEMHKTMLAEELKSKKKKKKRKYKGINQDLKQIALERDGYRCAECGIISNLEIHHIEHRANGGNDDIDNLITLCVYCHYEQHKHQPIGRLMLSNMKSKGLIRSE